MIQTVINAIASTLHTTFGDSYTIYDKPVEQGFNEPCFSIVMIQQQINKLAMTRSRRTTPFVIHYFGENKIAVLDTLIDVLDEISFQGNNFRATNVYGEIDDVNNVLHFYVNYNYELIDTTHEVEMSDLSVEMK